MQKTVLKQHYKFTLYHLETYYSKECKLEKYWANNAVYYEEKTWVNQSNYEEVYSLSFSDESKLKAFLRDRYKADYYCSFYTLLGNAIKNCTVHNAQDWIAIVSTAHCEESISFSLRERKKTNRFPKKKKSRFHDYYKSDYDWLGREIKRKHINKFINNINSI